MTSEQKNSNPAQPHKGRLRNQPAYLTSIRRENSVRPQVQSVFERVRDALIVVAFFPHWRTFRKGTYYPMRRILNATTDSELRDELQKWFKYKERESGYVQVAGAVIFATVTSCLSWNTIDSNTHWVGPALWYGAIVLSITCIFTGAQQSLVLSEASAVEDFAAHELDGLKDTFVHQGRDAPRASWVALFAWQIPVMLLGYSVFVFLAGLCAVVITPLAANPGWNNDAKTVTVFCSISVFCMICWLFPSAIVHRIRAPQPTV